jgi:integrase
VPKVHLYDGCIVIQIKYLKPSRTGVWFYYRKIPKALRIHYSGKLHILKSLGTRDLKTATREALRLARADDVLWKSLQSPVANDLGPLPQETRDAAKTLLANLGFNVGDRALKGNDWDLGDVFDEHLEKRYGADEGYLEARHGLSSQNPMDFLNGVDREALHLLNETPGKPQVFLSDALTRYLSDHPKGSQLKFSRDTTRVIETVYSCVGDLPLEAYDRDHARTIRDTLASGRSSATVERRLDILIAVFNSAKREFTLRGLEHPFAGLPIQGQGLDTKARIPFNHEELVTIAAACRAKDDDRRHILALQLDTGARLGEIVGLRVSDVVLDGPVPYIDIRPYPAVGRTLKTPQSARRVPLVSEALWSAQQSLKATKGPWLFPRYSRDHSIKADYASATLNKWLREHLKLTKTTHCLRHSMKDRLRLASVPRELQEVLLGHGSRSVGDRYGSEYPLELLRESMTKVALRCD